MCSNILQPFNYIVENNIQPENIYNMDKEGFLIGCNKRRKTIVRKGRKNPSIMQENSWEFVTAIESIYADGTKLPLFNIFCRVDPSYW